jgi:hypothetical protein
MFDFSFMVPVDRSFGTSVNSCEGATSAELFMILEAIAQLAIHCEGSIGTSFLKCCRIILVTDLGEWIYSWISLQLKFLLNV